MIAKKLWALILCLNCFFLSSIAQEKYSKVKIPVTSPEIKKFIAERLNADHFLYEGKSMVITLNSEEMARLRQSNYPFQVIVDDMVQHTIEVNKNTTPSDVANRAAIQGNGCQKVATIIPTPTSFGTGGSLRLGASAGNPGYFTYAEMITKMQALQTAYPTLVSVYSIGTSAGGLTIYGVKISDNVATDENEPEVLFTGLQHAREAIGGTSMIFFMQYLAENYSNADQKIKALVDNREIFVIPCLNPDGYSFNYGGSSASYPVTGGGLWRKNRRNTGGGASNIGVDLNRNYGIDWGNCSGASASCGSNVKTDDTYYGPSAFSEPETQALRDFVYTRHFINSIDQHCFGPYYSLPYGRPTLHPVLNHVDSSYYKYVPALMGLYNGHRAGNSPETVNYEVAGGIKDWLLLGDIGTGTGPKGKIYGMTGEAGGGDFWAPVAQIPQLCKENCFQNLQLVYAAGDYYDVNDRKDIAVTSLTGKFAFDIRKVGLGTGSVTISLIPIKNVSSVGSPITTTIPTYYDTYIDSIDYTLPVTVACGQKIQFAWKVESGGIATYDTVTKYYNPVTLLSDDMEGTFATNWTATISPTGPTGWSFTTLAAFGGTRSMTESPTGNYTVSSTRTVTYKSTFNLTDANEAYLSFWVKHRAENFRDKLQVQVSTNGSTWFPLCGTTTVTEDNTTNQGFLGGAPALTGIRDNWTRELFDLTGYKGNATVSLRFVFTSDNDASAFAFELDDGFYIDNLKAIKVTNAVVPPPAAPASANATICTGNTATLTATGTAILGWYSASSGGTYLGGGASYTTPVLNATTTYYVQDSLCSPSTTRTAVVVTVNQNSTLTLSSAPATTSQTVCRNNSITNITYVVAGGGTGASITAGALPAGVTGTYSAGIFTISGTPTVAGTFNYTVTTTGPCTNTSLSGTITVNASASLSLTSAPATNTQTVCINNAITSITYALTGGTGAAITAGALPSGITGVYNAGVFTISGTATAAGTFNYIVSPTGSSCVNSLSGTITVNANSTLSLTSAGATTSQTLCINNAITNITYAIGGAATSASITAGALPAGVTGTFNAGVFSISGTPTASGTFNYTVAAAGTCANASLNGTITVIANATISLTSAGSTTAQTVCSGNAITAITYATGGTATGASITAGALPLGVTGVFNAGVFTISGTATVAGTYNYTVSPTGICVGPSLNGSITVIANATISLSSAGATAAQTICLNNPITTITYAIGGGATGASITAGLLPSGVTGSYNAGVFTISGFGNIAGNYNFTVSTTGPCGNASLNATITVLDNSTLQLVSGNAGNQVVCIDQPIQNIVYQAGGSATGVIVSGLPAGLTSNFSGGLLTISGSPSVTGSLSFQVTTTGPCNNTTQFGSIQVLANATIQLTSAPGTISQTVCAGVPIADIVYQIGGTATGVFINGTLPPGVTGSLNGNIYTISGTPAASGTFTYQAFTMGGCSFAFLSGGIAVDANASIFLTSATGTAAQTVCTGAAITNITYAAGAATNISLTTGTLPSGVTAAYNAGQFTISGTPTSAGIYNYTLTATGNCAPATISGTITVNAASTINLTSGTGTDTQTACTNNAITAITYAIAGSATGASVTAGTLPSGVTGSYNAGVFTISGTPTAAGTFNYTVTTTGPCAGISLSGTITVNAGSTISLTSVAGTAAQVVCADNSITDITYAVSGGATGASVTAGSLPTGVTGSYNAGVFTISGTPTATGTFNYTITTTGPCVNASLSGTITVNEHSTLVLTSAAGTDGQVLCSNSAITNISYAIGGGGTGASITAGTLPAGVTGTFSAGVFTISGTAGGSGSYNYTITTTGPCNSVSLNGTISINLNGTISLSSAAGSDAQTICSNSAITPISYAVGGSGSGTVVTGLPAGVTGTFNAGVFTISGTPATGGVYNYTVTTTGGSCAQGTAEGIITVNAITLAVVKNNISVCGGTNDGSISINPSGGTAPYTYSWTGSNGYTAGNTASITNLPIGFYNVMVTDAIGCTTTMTNIHIESAFAVYVTASGTMSGSCAPTGSILLYGNAGVQPYTYSIDGTNYQVSNTFTGLAAGSYTGYVKDAAGCVSTKSVAVTAAAPISVTSTVKGTSACANDGSIEIFRTGGIAPYTYSLDNITYQVNNKFLNLAAGSYTIYVKDSKNCTGTQNVTVTQTAAITLTAGKINTSTCVNNGSIQANTTGGTAPYTFNLNGGTYQASNAFAALGAGNYIVGVKDSKGCTQSIVVSIGLNQIVVTAYAGNASTCVSNNGLIQLFRTGGYGPYTYSLDGNVYQSSTVFNNRPAGTYTGYVKDAVGCIGTLSGIVVGPIGCGQELTGGPQNTAGKSKLKASLKIQAYPNPGTVAFTIALTGYNSNEKVSIIITDVLGRKIYQSTENAVAQYKIGSNFKTGIYLVEIRQGDQKQSLKLVKE